MKRAFILTVVLAVGTLMITACGGGGGGGGGGSKGLAGGGFIKTVALGTTAPWSAPFTENVSDHEQHLFFSQDINGSGNLESISFRYQDNELVSINCPDVTIKMGNSSISALSTTYAANVEQGRGSLVTVRSGALTAPAGSVGDYFTITLDTLFNYNGVDNLVVEFTRTQACDGDIRLQATSAVYTDVSLHKWNNVDITGDLYDNYLNAKFTFEGGDNILDYGDTLNNFWPFSSELPRIQSLYLASDIDGSGPITGLAYQLNQVSTEQTFTYSVTMGHTTLSALGTTYADNYNAGSPVSLANAATFTVPAGIPAGEWFWVPLPNNTFNYNGADNLVVEVEVTAGSGNIDLRKTNLGVVGTRAWGSAGNSVADGIDDNAYHVKLRFNGGTMDVITDGGGTGVIIPVGSGTEYIVQILYDNTALGTSGWISEFGFRLGENSTAFDHTDLNLVLGHTTLSSLGTASLAANIESDLTATFTGTLSVPAGLKAGDWVTIPLTTPFYYDATKNLVVQWDAPAYGTLNQGMGHTSDPGRYGGHVEGNIGDRTSDVAITPGSFVMDMSLTM